MKKDKFATVIHFKLEHDHKVDNGGFNESPNDGPTKLLIGTRYQEPRNYRVSWSPTPRPIGTLPVGTRYDYLAGRVAIAPGNSTHSRATLPRIPGTGRKRVGSGGLFGTVP